MSSCVVHWRGKKIKFRTDCYVTFKRVEGLLQWAHKRKFPNVTINDQKAKVEEELQELAVAAELYKMDRSCKYSQRMYYREFADVCLAVHGLMRFESDVTRYFLKMRNIVFEFNVEIGVPVIIEKFLEVYFIRTYVNNRHI
jgi:hypothetical protein